MINNMNVVTSYLIIHSSQTNDKITPKQIRDHSSFFFFSCNGNGKN